MVAISIVETKLQDSIRMPEADGQMEEYVRFERIHIIQALFELHGCECSGGHGFWD